ncbi:phosphotransferase [Roseomonas gilardii]|uniref:Phosphotransferase n=1 Tax=Roseomonas gilardii TaxID=257708 RepID=A0ABU3MDC2_9PROT|nr:phosphotransferase [Roseomonas gilardii]MDT8330923.1 phosphotransferase [Roseomonas gilardii]
MTMDAVGATAPNAETPDTAASDTDTAAAAAPAIETVTADAFLAAHGFAGAAREPLPGDAGRRRYTRLRGGPAPALLMDCSAEPEVDLHPFLRMQGPLAAAGLSVPRILARDDGAGLLLVEELGERTHADLLDAGAAPAPLYAAAGEALAALHAVPPPPDLPAWDGAAMARTAAGTFLDWWWPAALGEAPSAAQREAFARAVHDTIAPFGGTRGLVHRDYFPANLTLVPGREGVRAVGILDFQDAALGHPAYDLLSLVEDARRDVAPEARAAAIAAYRRVRDMPDLEAAMAAHGAVRHLRVASLWVRLARRDGKPRYLVHGPRCWRLLAASLAHPAARPLASFLDAHVPLASRMNPPPKGS